MVKLQQFPQTGIFALLLTASATLVGCGGGEATTSASATPTTANESAGNAAITTTTTEFSISGSPSTAASIGSAYSFQPTVSGAGTLSYTVQNKPAWASFSTADGSLTGTPVSGDTGDFSGITISVTNGTASATLPAFRITVGGSSQGTAALAWNPPTENTDGSTVTSLGGYTIYYGTNPDDMTNKIQVTNSGLTSYTVSGLGAGTHYFGITAYTSAGVESEMSSIGSKTIT